MMLEVNNINVWYGVTEILRKVSLHVPEKSVVALLGGNGSGKTTVLNTVSGMISPRSGTVRFLGADITGAGPDRVVRAGMIQVPQGREVFASMSVRDNLAMGAATRRGGAAIRRDVEEIYELFPRLGEKKGVLAGVLSGGEQQQVAIGRALMAKPRLLLMDEPSVGLAPAVVDSMIETIRLLHERRGLTILIVEQNVGVAAAVAGTAYMLKDGEIVFTGDAAKLINDRRVLSAYLGR
jgi:branched-chain amino acid transport system ATP-binding protein